jgi:hypothetical protein
MTPTERAWSIVRDFVGKTFHGLGGELWLVGAISNALTEARAEGFRECQKKAAKVCDDTVHLDGDHCDVGARIKALAPEEK